MLNDYFRECGIISCSSDIPNIKKIFKNKFNLLLKDLKYVKTLHITNNPSNLNKFNNVLSINNGAIKFFINSEEVILQDEIKQIINNELLFLK